MFSLPPGGLPTDHPLPLGEYLVSEWFIDAAQWIFQSGLEPAFVLGPREWGSGPGYSSGSVEQVVAQNYN